MELVPTRWDARDANRAQPVYAGNETRSEEWEENLYLQSSQAKKSGTGRARRPKLSGSGGRDEVGEDEVEPGGLARDGGVRLPFLYRLPGLVLQVVFRVLRNVDLVVQADGLLGRKVQGGAQRPVPGPKNLAGLAWPCMRGTL